MIPKKAIALLFADLIWLFVAVRQWAYEFVDYSQLIFALAIFFGILYVVYDQWYKVNAEIDSRDVKKDIQAIDTKCNKLETKLIDHLNKKR